jgi:SpoIID/LytB domain protein
VGEQVRLGRAQSSGRVRIETISLDDYVAQVLAGEGQPAAGDAAQQALAITARTFAVANRGRHRREGFDLCDTTHCQVVRPATAVTRRAAAATADQVLLHGGRPAPVFYSASCGGQVERASQVWPGAADLSQPDRDDAHADEPPWSSDVRAADVARALRTAGLRGARLRSLRVLQRNQSGRVVRLRAEGFSPSDISGNDFRLALGRVAGWQLVKSTAFDVQRSGAVYRFRGRGYGHGVGLCVVGAGARAQRGETMATILKFYFPSLSVDRVPATLSATVAGEAAAPNAATGAVAIPAAEGAAPAAPTPAPRDSPDSRRDTPAVPVARDVQIALPVAEEDARATLLTLFRQARDEIAAATGRKAPDVLKVTVHPTVESFSLATGQPWWVSGATTGGDVALPPISLLQQRGQLEREVRHEVAHAMLDAAFDGRPRWVREGAALYFSQTARGSAGVSAKADAGSRTQGFGRVTCPTAAELLRPSSAGAQREAYARAEACFARQISAGKKWSEVK